MLRDREPCVREAHAALEEKAAKRVRPAKTTVDFRVQRADENQTEGRQCAQMPKHVKPGRPPINHDVTWALFSQSTNESGQSPQSVNGKAGIEASTRADFYAFPNGPINLARVRGKDDGLVPARDEFPGKERDLKFRAARSAL